MVKTIARSVLIIFAFQCYAFLTLAALRSFVEARYIPSTSMQPTLNVGDRIILEKVTRLTGQMNERGAVVCLYPPANCMPDWKGLSYDLPHILGRLTGLPIFPNTPVFVKRIIAIAGDRVKIEPGVGVYVNDKLLSEPYASEPPDYKLASEVAVPKGSLFVLGDDRNNSEDSHLWGCINEDSVIGRIWLHYSELSLTYAHEAYWTVPAAKTVKSKNKILEPLIDPG